MKMKDLLCGACFLLATSVVNAAPVLIVGQPGDDLLATPSQPSIELGGAFLNFDSLTPFASYSTYTEQGVSISSPDGLVVLPFSTQSGPNELFDDSADGTANITLSFLTGQNAIGVGIADSDAVSITIQALGLGGVDLGAPFVENLAATESAINFGNGYYAVEDTGNQIYGLQITQSSGSADFSGLAIDDVQVTPEPPSFMLLAPGLLGLLFFGSFRRRMN